MINRIFSDIYNNVCTNIQDTSSAMQTIVKNYCNNVYFDILRRINWDNINTSYTLTTTAGTQDYALPSNFGKEVYVYDQTNLIELSYIDIQELVRDYRGTLSSVGQSLRYSILNKPCINNPTSSSILSIVSSSTADTSQTIRVTGINSSDIEVSESITLNGTTTATSTNSYKEIRSITKSASTIGYITITSNSGEVTIAILSSISIAYNVKSIRLHLIPSSILTLSIPYSVIPYPLINDYDQPVIDCAVAIELGATMLSWKYKRQFSKSSDYERKYEKEIDNIIWDKENSINRIRLTGVVPYSRGDY